MKAFMFKYVCFLRIISSLKASKQPPAISSIVEPLRITALYFMHFYRKKRKRESEIN